VGVGVTGAGAAVDGAVVGTVDGEAIAQVGSSGPPVCWGRSGRLMSSTVGPEGKAMLDPTWDLAVKPDAAAGIVAPPRPFDSGHRGRPGLG
jgi:hypothetical protein